MFYTDVQVLDQSNRIFQPLWKYRRWLRGHTECWLSPGTQFFLVMWHVVRHLHQLSRTSNIFLWIHQGLWKHHLLSFLQTWRVLSEVSVPSGFSKTWLVPVQNIPVNWLLSWSKKPAIRVRLKKSKYLLLYCPCKKIKIPKYQSTQLSGMHQNTNHICLFNHFNF